jgi:hypothetical protein
LSSHTFFDRPGDLTETHVQKVIVIVRVPSPAPASAMV